MASKKGMFSIDVSSDDVMFTNISTSKNGYNQATMAVKKGDDEYMSISYEWSGDTIPAFAMDLMKFMKNKGMEKSGIVPGQEDAYEEFAKAKKGDKNPGGKQDEDMTKKKKKKDEKDSNKKDEKMCETCGKPKSECNCGKTKSQKEEDTLKEED